MTRPRRASQRDANQGEIVDGLERCGYTVIDISTWCAFADILVWGDSWHTQENEWMMFELKTATGTLTEAERDFQDQHPGAVTTARMLEAVLARFGRM